MPKPKPKKKKLSDVLAKRKRKGDPQSRTGIGGQARLKKIDQLVDAATGKPRK